MVDTANVGPEPQGLRYVIAAHTNSKTDVETSDENIDGDTDLENGVGDDDKTGKLSCERDERKD